MAFDVHQCPPRYTGGHWGPPVNFPVPGILLLGMIHRSTGRIFARDGCQITIEHGSTHLVIDLDAEFNSVCIVSVCESDFNFGDPITPPFTLLRILLSVEL
jgi:hypothetical protein